MTLLDPFRKSEMNLLALLTLLACLVAPALSQINASSALTGGNGVRAEFRLIYWANSDFYQSTNRSDYYCIFRALPSSSNNLSLSQDAPAEMFSTIVMYAAMGNFTPWMNGQVESVGVEDLVQLSHFGLVFLGILDVVCLTLLSHIRIGGEQTGNTSGFVSELSEPNTQVLDYIQANGFIINRTTTSISNNNFAFLPPIRVNVNNYFVSAITSFQPSPDWFTGFYLFDTVNSYTGTYWQRFTLQTFPFFTENYTAHTSTTGTTIPPGTVERMEPHNSPKHDPFLNADGTKVLPVAEFDCVLNVCPIGGPECTFVANWPPVNHCDIFKYPTCATYCDPQTTICQSCQGNGHEASIVYFTDCCASGHEPTSGWTCAQIQAATSGTARRTCAIISSLVLGWTLVILLR